MVGNSGTTSLSTDGGNSWTPKSINRSINIMNVSYPAPGLAIIRDGIRMHVYNGEDGKWEEISGLPSIGVNASHFEDRNRGYFAGNGGQIHATKNGFGFSQSAATNLSIVNGAGQISPVNRIANEELQVIVKNGQDNPMNGSVVKFKLISSPEGASGFEFTEKKVLTGDDGLASAKFRVGDIGGDYIIEAKSPGTDAVQFILTAEESVISDFIVISGDHQTAIVNNSAESSLTVKVLDTDGAGIIAIPVEFKIISVPQFSSGSSLTRTSVNTDEDGLAATRLLLGTAPGNYSVEASIPGNDDFTVTFTVNAVQLTTDDFAWNVINPTPQPNELLSVKMLDQNTAVAVGANGTIKRTVDGGVSWDIQYMITGENILLNDVAFSGNTGLIVGQNGVALKTVDGGMTWGPLNTETSVILWSVQFLDQNTIWVAGNGGTILRSIDGGATWIDKSLDVSASIRSIHFIDNETGYVSNSEIASADPVYKTEDGGETWVGLTLPDNPSVFDLVFTDMNNGWGGAINRIYKTVDGGVNWTYTQIADISPGFISRFYSLQMINSSTGYAADNTGRILKTNDGETWSVMSTEQSNAYNGLHFTDSNRGMFVGVNGLVEKTENSGGDIISLSNQFTNLMVYDIHYVSETKGFMVLGNSTIYTTTNGGDTWTGEELVNAGIFGNLGFSRIHFYGENHGWAVTLTGIVLKTTNGGDTWTEVEDVITTDSNRRLNFVQALDENTVILGGGNFQTRHLKKTLDGGENWTDISSGLATNAIRDIHFVTPQFGYLINQYTVYKTENGGSNWVEASVFNLNNAFTRIQFIDEQTGYLLSDENLKKTTDSGATWTNADPNNSVRGRALFMLNAETGWVVGNEIWSTSDGESWSEIRKQATQELTAVHAVSEKKVWASGFNGIMMRPADAVVTSNESDQLTETPGTFILEQNYPNPFNPSTNIRFTMSESAMVSLSVYNVIGQRVAVLVNGNQMSAGQHNVNFDASRLASGMYLYRIEIIGNSGRSFSDTGKMMLIK